MRPRILPIGSPAISGVVDGRAGHIVYWALRETSGTNPAMFRLWDGSNNQGSMIAPFSLDPGESIRENSGMHSLPYRVGLYLEILSGTIEGQITSVLWDDWPEQGGIPVFVIGSVEIDVRGGGGI
jgi:hypothetical protein